MLLIELLNFSRLLILIMIAGSSCKKLSMDFGSSSIFWHENDKTASKEKIYLITLLN